MSEPKPVVANAFDRQWKATREAVLEAVARVGESGWYILGKEVAGFEAELAQVAEAAHAVGCASGLDAIELSLRALGLKPGEPVLTTPLSAFATTLAIIRAGGEPVFVDVDECGLLDLELADRCLQAHPSIRFMVPVHLFGQALDLDRLQQLAQARELRVVEDAAQAILARSGGRPVGAVGAAATFSFYPTKNLGALGDGGCLITADPQLAEAVRSLRDYGQSGKYVHSQLGLNSRLDELHAAILRSAMLPRLPEWTARRTAIAQRYSAGLRHPRVAAAPSPARSQSAFHLYPVLVEAPLRDALLSHLRQGGVQAAVHYPRIIPDQPALTESGPVRVHGDLKRARDYAARELSLPIHPFLTDEEVDRVIAIVNAWAP